MERSFTWRVAKPCSQGPVIRGDGLGLRGTRRIREGVPGEPMNGHYGVLKTAGAAKPPGVRSLSLRHRNPVSGTGPTLNELAPHKPLIQPGNWLVPLGRSGISMRRQRAGCLRGQTPGVPSVASQYRNKLKIVLVKSRTGARSMAPTKTATKTTQKLRIAPARRARHPRDSAPKKRRRRASVSGSSRPRRPRRMGKRSCLRLSPGCRSRIAPLRRRFTH